MVCEELGNVTWCWAASEFLLQAKQVGEAAGGRVWRSGGVVAGTPQPLADDVRRMGRWHASGETGNSW